MYLKIADPSNYPFGLLSIYYRERGYTLAEDAAHMSIPSELQMHYPLQDDNTYFSVLKSNFLTALANYVEKFAIEASIYRAKRYFPHDLLKLRQSSRLDQSKYAQQLLAMSWEPIDPATGASVPVDELARVIQAVRHAVLRGDTVDPMPYRVLVDQYVKNKNITAAPLRDIRQFSDLGRIVETVKELDGVVIHKKLIQRVKDELMNKYLDKVLEKKYPHIEKSMYTQAKEEQYLRHYTGHLEEKIYTMWKNGYIPLEDVEGISEQERLSLLITEPEDMSQETPIENCLMTSKNIHLPRLSLDFSFPFNIRGKTFTSPAEYGLKKGFSLFSLPEPSTEDVKTLASRLTSESTQWLKSRLRQMIYTFMLNKSRDPIIWTLLHYPEQVEWKGYADFIKDKWLTAMYNSVRQQITRPPALLKPFTCTDLTQNQLTAEWFRYRILLWKSVAIKHKPLFLVLSERFNRSDYRFPTQEEKLFLSGCDQDVWRVIISEFTDKFSGTTEEVYKAIIREATEWLPVPPTLKSLHELFKPIFAFESYGYANVSEMVGDLVVEPRNRSLIILWIRLFL